jgi:hypothetical protein
VPHLPAGDVKITVRDDASTTENNVAVDFACDLPRHIVVSRNCTVMRGETVESEPGLGKYHLEASGIWQPSWRNESVLTQQATALTPGGLFKALRLAAIDAQAKLKYSLKSEIPAQFE